MARINRVRLVNVIYNNGTLRYNDSIFDFDGKNSVILIENGMGKTVFLQTVFQAIIPHIDVAGRKIRESLSLNGDPAHIAIEWIINEKPRVYAQTVVSLYINDKNALESEKYVFEHKEKDENRLEMIPFVRSNESGNRPASRAEISEYYKKMARDYMTANTFDTIDAFCTHLEKEFDIIRLQWERIALINQKEGGVDEFFAGCKTSETLLKKLLIPTVEPIILSGSDTDFIDTFEKQRENIKENNRLLKEISNFKSVQNEMNAYIESYKTYEESLKQHRRAYDLLLGLREHIDGIKNRDLLKLQELGEEILANKADQAFNKYRELSCEVHGIELKIEAGKTKTSSLSKKLESIKTSLEHCEKRTQNIRISAKKDSIITLESQEKIAAEELENLSKNTQDKEYREELEKYKSYIHGHFKTELKTIESDRNKLKGEQSEMSDLCKAQNAKVSACNEALQEKKGEHSKQLGMKSVLENEMSDTKDKIVFLGDISSVAEQRNDYSLRIKHLNTNKASLRDSLLANKEKKEQNDIEIRNLDAELRDLVSSQSTVRAALNEYSNAANKIIPLIYEHLGEIILEDIGVFYLKETQILARLNELKLGALGKYNQALKTERINSRQHLMYKDSDYFMADPNTVDIVQKLKGDLPSCMAGSRYVNMACESAGISLEKAYQIYPFWAMSIIVNSKEIKNAKIRTEQHASSLTHPIFLITPERVKSFLDLGGNPIKAVESSNQIFPSTWSSNLDENAFEDWKKSIGVIADESTKARKCAGLDLDCIKELQNSADYFYKSYAYKAYLDLKRKSEELDKELSKADEKKARLSEEQRRLNKEKESVHNDLAVINEEESAYNRSLELCNRYLSKKHELAIVEEKISVCAKELGRIKLNLEELNRGLSSYLSIKEEIDEAIRQNSFSAEKLLGNELYRECSQSAVLFSSEPIEFCKSKKQSLEDKVKGISDSQKLILQRLESAKSAIAERYKEMESLVLQAKYEIEYLKNYSSSEIETLSIKINELANQKSKLEFDLFEIGKAKAADERELELKLKEIAKLGYDSAHKEESGINLDSLDLQRLELEKKEQSLCKIETKLKASIEEDEENVSQLEKASYQYFVESDSTTDVIGKDEYINYEHNKNIEVLKYKNALKDASSKAKENKQLIAGKLQEYIAHCDTSLASGKLKETCIKTVKNSANYADLCICKSNIDLSLNRSIEIANENVRRSDNDLEAFYNQIGAFAKNVIAEIKLIQTKTRIKTASGTVQVYDFVVPDLDDSEYKSRIRRYFGDLISEYEGEIKNKRDQKLLRLFLSKKINAYQMINVILNDQKILIKCRKVNNQNEISKRADSWETSNNWSCGENWSKYMTLFLGILNYISEKRLYKNYKVQAENPAHINVDNTVIMDNPFGAASSSHILKPVFNIAKKLGFQMLALTAHSSGEYISKYFPVVYSGKAIAAGAFGETKVISMDKTENPEDREMDTVFLNDLL